MPRRCCCSQFLVTTFREQRRLFDDPISELRIGIFSNSNKAVITVHEHACLSEVLDLLETHGEEHDSRLHGSDWRVP